MKRMEVIDLLNRFNGEYFIYEPILNKRGDIIDHDCIADHRSNQRQKEKVLHRAVHDFTGTVDAGINIYLEKQHQDIKQYHAGGLFEEVIMSGEYPSRDKKLSRLAQAVYAKDKTQSKEDCVWQALELYEDMTGAFIDPTQEQFDALAAAII